MWIMHCAGMVHQQHTAKLQQGMAPHRQVNPMASLPQATAPQQAMDPLWVSSTLTALLLGCHTFTNLAGSTQKCVQPCSNMLMHTSVC